MYKTLPLFSTWTEKENENLWCWKSWRWWSLYSASWVKLCEISFSAGSLALPAESTILEIFWVRSQAMETAWSAGFSHSLLKGGVRKEKAEIVKSPFQEAYRGFWLWENRHSGGNNACGSIENKDRFVYWEGDAGILYPKQNHTAWLQRYFFLWKSKGQARVKLEAIPLKRWWRRLKVLT